MAGRELKGLLNSGDQGATSTASISIAGATVELPPEQRKCFADDKHPFTATSFDFLTCVVVRKCVSQSLQEAVKVVPSNVVADIIAGGEAAPVEFDGVRCLRSGQLGDPTRLVDLWGGGDLQHQPPRPPFSSIPLLWVQQWGEGICSTSPPPPPPFSSISLLRVQQWGGGDLQLQPPSAPPPFSSIPLLRSSQRLDAVVGHDPAPRIAKPIARTLTTLRQDAKRAAEELAFKSRCGIADGHGGDAHGDERLRSQEQPAGSHFSGRDTLALTTALALANAGEGDELSAEQAKPDNKEEGSSSDRGEDAPVNAPRGGCDKSPSEEADGQGRGQAEGDAAERDDVAMDNRGSDLELQGSEEMEEEEDDDEEEEVEEIAANTAGRAAVAVAGAGKSIRNLHAALFPRPRSATPSGEFAGKSPVAGKRKHSELAKLQPGKLAEEILRLDKVVKNQKGRITKLEEVVEAKAAAKDRAENRDMREVLTRAAARLEDYAANLKGVVVDSMENAQKKLTDEVARKIDGASSNIAATSERAITTSGVTNALNTVIAMLSGRAATPPGTDAPQGQGSDGVAEKEGGKRVVEKETGKKVADKETVKKAADKETGLFPRGTTRGDADAGPPPGPSAVEVGKGKAKVEDAPPATTTTNTTVLVLAAGNTTAVAPGQPGPSSIAPAIPPSVDVKAKTQGRGGCKPPPATLKVDDNDSDADDEVELVLQRFVGPSDTSGTSGKRKGCGIRPPPRGGEGMVGEPWLGGRRCWLGHHSHQEVEYLTAIAVMCYDKKIDPGLKLTAQQKSECAEDISAAGTMCTGLFATMHLHNLYHHMFKAYHDLTRPKSTLGNADAWAAAVGKEAADEEPDVTGAQEGLFAGAVACAIAMMWETCNGLDLDGNVDAGYVAALSAGTPEDIARGYPSIVTVVLKRARKESTRTNTTEVTEKIESAVVNRLGARLGDPTLVAMVAHEAVDVLMTWSDCKIAAKLMEANGIYLALPEKRLSAKKRSA
ncbi:unnamed protein product [Closterium sp. Naga37s-1]|nr:unnamed protein product [Closterium sp. Naga37s-1]